MGIAIDAMGGDFAPSAVVDGAVRASRRSRQPLLLVGDASAIHAELARHETDGLDLEVVHASQVVAMDDLNPAATVRAQPDASISVCMALVREGRAKGVVSMGHTGAGLAAALLRLGRLPGVRRPALATPFPTRAGPCVLLDVGGNVDVKPLHLLQFAVMGAAYANGVLGIHQPRVGLVSIGEEQGKGSAVVQAAWPLLEASDLNFVGNVEGRHIPAGTVDVAVVDGFTGNVLIKFAEGLAQLIQEMMRDAARGNPMALVGGALIRPSMRRARKRMDYRAYGGAALLGVRGMVVIGHGRSDAEAVVTAIDVARRGLEHDIARKIGVGVLQGQNSGETQA